MAQDLTPLNPEYWSRRMQVVRIDESVYPAIANMEERAMLKDGDTVHRPMRSRLRVQTYTKGTAITVPEQTATDESLSVSTTKVVAFYVDDVEALQSKYDVVNSFADDAARKLETFIDGDFLSEVVNADSDVDDGDIGGTDGVSAIISTSNIQKLFASAAKKLDRLNIARAGRYAVISPSVHQILVEKLDGKDSALGDSTGKNGMVGQYMGFTLHLSNNVYWTARWTPANNPSESDTVTIAGVVFTFNATPSGAGSIDIGGSTAASIDNLLACINGTGTAGTDYIALSEASKEALEGLVAVDGTTYLGVTWDGGGEVDVSALEVADPWSLETVHCMFGQKGAVDMVVQQMPNVEFKDVSDKLGKNVLTWTLYGLKTFDEGDAAMVDVKVDSSTF